MGLHIETLRRWQERIPQEAEAKFSGVPNADQRKALVAAYVEHSRAAFVALAVKQEVEA